MVLLEQIEKVGDVEYRIKPDPNRNMRVPVTIYANDSLLSKMVQDRTIDQAINVTTLPGVQKHVVVLPDGHEGYGFPVGGVAAMDVENGVISPGGVGYDINCLAGNSMILHKFGYRISINHFENKWNEEEIKCIDYQSGVKNTSIVRFIKLPSKKKVYRVRTNSGREIIATEDHPFLTPRGMMPLREIDSERIAVYPFEGVRYRRPSKNTIVSEKDIGKLKIYGDKDAVISELKKRNLLPLCDDNPSLPYLLKLMAFIMGDGHLIYTKKTHTAGFTGKKDDLEEIRDDIMKIGFKPSKVYIRRKLSRIRTKYNSYEFFTDNYSFKVGSRSFIALLIAMGTPHGNKAKQDYGLPRWLFRLPLWMKRLFLASFFGAKLSSPKTITGHGYNFYSPILTQQKKTSHARSGIRLLQQISRILSEFGIDINKISTDQVYTGTSEPSARLRLQVDSRSENLIKLWSTIGFEYNKRKTYLANVAVQYLKLKCQVIDLRQQTARIAVALKRQGSATHQIYELLTSEHVNRGFVSRSLNEGRTNGVRIAFNFPTFDEFLKASTEGLGETGMVWDEILVKEPITFNGYVYDFTVRDDTHNFIANGFVVSNCGVRLIRTNLNENDVRQRLRELVNELFRAVPSGVGSEGAIKLTTSQLDQVLTEGVNWAIKNGYGYSEDAEVCEESGQMEGADPNKVSNMARKRGAPQLGSLGSGNHFLEVQKVDKIFDHEAAKRFGIDHEGQVTVLIHCGSRGFGHQVCSDYLRVSESALRKYNIQLPDRELACVPNNSQEGESYRKAMYSALNFAWSNRQMITHWTRKAFEKVFNISEGDLGMKLVYDVAHNIAKVEKHKVDGSTKEVVVHRKGATRAFPSGKEEVPSRYRDIGQPVLIPGSMGTASYILLGGQKSMELTFGSTAHGAGRTMSRSAAKRSYSAQEVQKRLESKGIYIKALTREGVVEETPEAYKNVDSVADVSHAVGIATKVARLTPIGVIKG